MTRTIVVGYDGTDHGDDALALGRLLAGIADAELVVACAYPDDPLGESAAALEVAQGMREDAEAEAGAGAGVARRAEADAAPGGGASLRAVAGASPSHVLHDLAEALGRGGDRRRRDAPRQGAAAADRLDAGRGPQPRPMPGRGRARGLPRRRSRRRRARPARGRLRRLARGAARADRRGRLRALGGHAAAARDGGQQRGRRRLSPAAARRRRLRGARPDRARRGEPPARRRDRRDRRRTWRPRRVVLEGDIATALVRGREGGRPAVHRLGREGPVPAGAAGVGLDAPAAHAACPVVVVPRGSGEGG